LNARVIDVARIDIPNKILVITPINRFRWDINLHAALRWASQENKVTTIFISKHTWKDRNATADLIQDMCGTGDNTNCPIPGIFPYVEGTPVCLNKNMLSGLHAANGALYEAVGIVPDPKAHTYCHSDGITVHVGAHLGLSSNPIRPKVSDSRTYRKIVYLSPRKVASSPRVTDLERRRLRNVNASVYPVRQRSLSPITNRKANRWITLFLDCTGDTMETNAVSLACMSNFPDAKH
jgi:hypothetical protein